MRWLLVADRQDREPPEWSHDVDTMSLKVVVELRARDPPGLTLRRAQQVEILIEALT
jgi:hypothetical protein